MTTVERSSRHRQAHASSTDSLAPVARGDRALRSGERGADVVALQRLLNEKGAHLEVDGSFGPKTEAAVRGFQRRHGLEVDGVVGKATLHKLRTRTRPEDNDRLVKPGSNGKDVLAAEKRLVKLGYDTGRVDGRFDQQTARAVRAFKADEGLQSRSGALGKRGKDALEHAVRAQGHAPYTARVKNTGEHRRLDALTAEKAGEVRDDGSTGLREGDSGRTVKNVQAHLKGTGFSAGVVDGRYDERTAGAVKAFQKKSGLEVTGRMDNATWRALSRTRLQADNATSPAQRKGERSAAVKHTEEQLRKAGYNPGKVDGVFDNGTLKALHKFEREHHLARTDSVGRTQLRAIEKTAKHSLVRPIESRLTAISEYGVRDAEGAPANSGARFHAGKDWFAPGGSTVRAPVDGKVVEVRASRGNSGQVFGGTVKVQAKDGKVWVFRHVDPHGVRVGQQVHAGQRIAKVTQWRDGPSHAHIELWKTYAGGYDFENMLDPMKFLKRFL